MARLYLMRHATAVPHGIASQDAERVLTSEGFKEALGVGEGLKRLEIQPDYLISSPYARARQTAEQVASVLAPKVPIKELNSLRPESDPQATSAGLKPFQGAEHLFFFGHEPHMSAWVSWLVAGDAGLNCIMKKASVACVEVDRLPPVKGGGQLRWLMTPKQLTLIGS